MCVKSIEVAKQKASVITTYMQEQGVTLAHSNALHLVGRMEGFENWHAFRRSLVSGGPVAHVSREPEQPADNVKKALRVLRLSTLSSVLNVDTGQSEQWYVEWLTDNEGNWPTPARHTEEAEVREVLLLQKEGHLSSVARLGNETGILFEMQYYCTESAPDVAQTNPDIRPYEETVAALARWHKPLSSMFKGISVGIPYGSAESGDHVKLWVFMPQGYFTKQERVELDNWLQRVGYPDFKW